jgi:hypothetical protein
MSETPQRPAWFARRNISPFTLDDAKVDEIIGTATHAVVSWVTKDNKPVSAVMLYLLIDGVITITSTTNRAKYHAWRRNPAASFCIWEPGNMGRQVTLRGHVEISKDAELLRRFTEEFLTRNGDGEPPSAERLATEIEKFDAPDRHMMQLHIDKVLTHDLFQLFQAEVEGTDVWS